MAKKKKKPLPEIVEEVPKKVKGISYDKQGEPVYDPKYFTKSGEPVYEHRYIVGYQTEHCQTMYYNEDETSTLKDAKDLATKFTEKNNRKAIVIDRERFYDRVFETELVDK